MKTHKILLVDDDIDVINISQAILEAEGYEVISANNKIDGYKKAWSEKPDIAILDVIMTTHYEGFELAREFSENPEFNNMPVLMSTSIDVLTTTKPYVQEMAREFRKDPSYKELDVILLKDIVSDNAGIDYLTEEGNNVWLKVDGFLPKPVKAEILLPEVKKLLQRKENKELVD